MKSGPIVLLTDFGLTDHYAGVLKGVMLSINPHANVIDLSHGVGPQNILQAALLLEMSYPFFPKGSIFMNIVDPGVGTSRKILCVKTKKYFFLAPDNGLLGPALDREGEYTARSVENTAYRLKETSSTFHGRDISSPAAAHLSRDPGIFNLIGPKVAKIVRIEMPKVKKSANILLGKILYFDHFGNAITNVRRRDAPESFWQGAHVFCGGAKIQIVHNYQESNVKAVAVFGSSSYLEIASPCGNYQEESRVKTGGRVEVIKRGV